MPIKKLILLFMLAVSGFAIQAQEPNAWNNKRCAVVLTYDDAISVHLTHALPALDSLGLKATFYLTCYAPAFTEHITEWRRASFNGHELGNHTLFHPCLGGTAGRDWVAPEYDLRHYSIRRMQDEMRMTNAVLRAVDGKNKRTFAYPCGDMRIHDSLYLDHKDFVAARGVEALLLSTREKNLYNLGSFVVNGQTGEQLIEEVKKAMQAGKAIVFLFHGVGGEHFLNVSLDAHSKLLHFLKEQEKEIWTTTFIEMAEWMKK